MNFHLIFIASILILTCVCKDLAIDTMPELKKNILNFGYGVNFKYEGILSHSFDKFYVVTKFEMPKFKISDSQCFLLTSHASIWIYPIIKSRDI